MQRLRFLSYHRQPLRLFAGRALGRSLYEQHADIGIGYQSRLTGGDCLAIFDRALPKLTPIKVGGLESHPELPDVLGRHHVRIER